MMTPWIRSCGVVVLLAMSSGVHAQRGGGGRGPSGKPAAPVDLTGYWVSVVTEDWRFRMVTPKKGDHPSVPLNAEGVRVADAWDPAKDEAAGEQCRAYGAAGVMRAPGRIHITWQDDNTLKVETEAGTQTRLLRFLGATAQTLLVQGTAVPALPADAMAPSWQGT